MIKETADKTIERLFAYPHGFERFYRVLLKVVLESGSEKSSDSVKLPIALLKTSVYSRFYRHIAKNKRIPAHNVFFKGEKVSGADISAVAATTAAYRLPLQLR